MNCEEVLLLSDRVFEYVRSCYRHLHAYPELSFCEFETSRFVQNELDKMGIPYKAGIGGTGVLGKIIGKKQGGKVIALRADMDALPISEAVDIPWKSTKEQVMHACGHDAHTACLLGAAKILNELKESVAGTVLLVFQPGEERAPGGARLMLEDGIFDEQQPDLIIGQHVSVNYSTGTLAFGAGKVMASADEIHLTIQGKGGHGALPHLLNDTVLAASQTIVSLQQVKSRLCPPSVPMVLTFGKLIANGATNVIPNEVHLSGTFRTMDEKWRAEAKQHIRRIVSETCAAYGCTVKIDMPAGYPCVENDVEITQKARLLAEELVGSGQIKDMETRMTSEDFGFFSQQYPCTFYRFGIKSDENASTGDLHTSTFCIDEEALRYGTSGLAWLAGQFLK